MKMKQSVPKRRYIKFRRRGITQKETYNICNTYCLTTATMVTGTRPHITLYVRCPSCYKMAVSHHRQSLHFNIRSLDIFMMLYRNVCQLEIAQWPNDASWPLRWFSLQVMDCWQNYQRPDVISRLPINFWN